MNKGEGNTINEFQNCCLRSLLKVKWQNKVSTKEPLNKVRGSVTK